MTAELRGSVPDGADPPPFAGLRRNARALAGGLVMVVALLVVLPDLGPEVAASPVTLQHGVIVRILDTGGDPTLPDAEVQLADGPRAGEVVGAYLQGPSGSQDVPRYAVGDEVVVSTSPDTSAPDDVYVAVTDRWRAPALALMVGVFALAVMVVGGWRGVRSLLALVLTLVVVVRVIVPLILSGWPPVPVAVAAASAVTLAAILLTEGLRPTTIAAVAGTFLALALVGVLAVGFSALASFTELQGAGDIVFLQAIGLGQLDLGGILLAAVILGALGVLDDVTITQAATVAELAEADPGAGRRRLAARAMNVGRSHIAATVNTLVLAYVGASLPLLLLFAAGRQDPALIASGEAFAVEVVRALAGSIGIVAAVPLTTGIALLLVPAGPKAPAGPDGRSGAP